MNQNGNEKTHPGSQGLFPSQGEGPGNEIGKDCNALLITSKEKSYIPEYYEMSKH